MKSVESVVPISESAINGSRYFQIDTADFWKFYQRAKMSGDRFFLEGVNLAWSKHWLRRIAEWVVDLVIVFVGVYAAFVLNAYESRREQSEQTLIEEALTDFNRRLNKGEMPELVYININSSYDSTFSLAFFQAGAGELLEVATLRQVRAVDKDSKLAAEDIKHFQALSASVLVPQLNHDRTFFYDPSSRRLLPQYAWYPTAFQDMVDHCNKIRPEIDELRKQIGRERNRNR